MREREREYEFLYANAMKNTMISSLCYMLHTDTIYRLNKHQESNAWNNFKPKLTLCCFIRFG